MKTEVNEIYRGLNMYLTRNIYCVVHHTSGRHQWMNSTDLCKQRQHCQIPKSKLNWIQQQYCYFPLHFLLQVILLKWHGFSFTTVPPHLPFPVFWGLGGSVEGCSALGCQGHKFRPHSWHLLDKDVWHIIAQQFLSFFFLFSPSANWILHFCLLILLLSFMLHLHTYLS